MKNNKLILVILVIIIILVIVLISYLKNNNNITEETSKCIAGKAILYTSKTCSHCAQQKQILGNYLSLFQIVDCLDNQQICSDKLIEFVPAWIINNQKHYGVKSLKELKRLTGC